VLLCDSGVNEFHPPRFAEELAVVEPRFALSPIFRFVLLLVSREALFAVDVPALGLLVPALLALRDSMPDSEVCDPDVTDETWFWAIDCCMRDVSCWNDAGLAALCVPAKCCAASLWMVEGAAARPLADKLDRLGTTGIPPVIMRAELICSCVAATAVTCPAPNWPACTVESAPPM
jgi:hypothetical protein